MAHPSEDIVGSRGIQLAGKRIVLCLTGSVAVVQAPELARLLMRHGAKVYPVMTRSATRLVGPDLMEWACGEKPVTRLSGAIEHVALVGNVPDPVDLVLVAPATANTVGKIAAGIDDTPVTTFVTTAWGQGIPIVVVPAMHQSMYDHPIVRENLRRLSQWGATVTQPIEHEGKAKMAEPEAILRTVLARLSPEGPLKGKRIVISIGRTEEALDPIRVITNPSTGKMGMALARGALLRGARVDLAMGVASEEPPPGCGRVLFGRTADSMKARIEELLMEKADVVIAAAAIGDWKPLQAAEKKIPTAGVERLSVDLVPTPKILDTLRDLAPQAVVVAFRALHGVTDDEARGDARLRLAKARADLIAINDAARPGQGFGTDTNRLLILDKEGREWDTSLVSKDKAAENLLDIISQKL